MLAILLPSGSSVRMRSASSTGQVHAVQRVVAGIGENFAALLALVALAGSAFTEFAAFYFVIVASHCEISC